MLYKKAKLDMLHKQMNIKNLCFMIKMVLDCSAQKWKTDFKNCQVSEKNLSDTDI